MQFFGYVSFVVCGFGIVMVVICMTSECGFVLLVYIG